jgi:NAD(P)-dependent dehydrogenase (short-subunit alcohol dehydrogenase family)
MRIEGANALVTGGASGLGAATARRLAAAGANVTIADVQVDKGQALAEEIGGRFAEVDVTKQEMVEAAVALAAEDGPLRISVTCAGVGWAQKTAGSKGVHPIEPFQTVVNINLVGTFNVLRYAAQKMIEGGEPEGEERGVIINTASIAAFDGQMGQIAYAASKGGVVGLTLPAARDLSRDRIRVCTIAPGLFDTPLLAALPEEARTKLGESVPHPARLGTTDEYAQLAQHIIENPMLNGETIRLDGALRMAPR